MGSQKSLDLIAVLARMHGAGRVHQPATWLQQRRQRLQQAPLQQRQLLNCRRRHAPAGIGMAGQGAQA